MHKAVLEGEAIDERFQRRARRAHRARHVDLPGAALVEIIRRADARQHVAAFIVDRDDRDRNVRPLRHRAVARQRFQRFLQGRIQRQLDQRRILHRRHRGIGGMRRQNRHRLAQPRHRGRLGLRRVVFRHHAILDHPRQHAIARGVRSFRITVEPAAFRRLRQRDQQCGFRKRKPFRLLAEIGDGCGADAFEIAAERRQRQIQIEDLVLAQLPLDLNRAHHLAQLCVHRALAPRLHQPRQLHRNGRAAGDDVAAGAELQRRAPERQRIDAAMRPEPAVFIRQQQLEISGVDRGLRIDRQPPAAVGHRIGAQQLAVAVDDRGRRLFAPAPAATARARRPRRRRRWSRR